MFCLRKANNLINRIHKSALRLCTENESLPSDVLLSHTKSATIHVQSLRPLLIEVNKSIDGLSSPILKSFFTIRKNPCNLRNHRELVNESTILYGIETVNYECSQLWSLLSGEIKTSDSLSLFKTHIKS